MKNLDPDLYENNFSHIYVEKNLWGHPVVKSVLQRFPKSEKIEIGHYKDVFCRRGQMVSSQKRAKALILAQKKGKLLYPGAKVCQNFGNAYFYYTSCVMNCIYHCEYCYLQGMYPSGHIVIFVNLDDVFCELELLLKKHPVYLCVSYDTDLLALEDLTGFLTRWTAFTREHENLQIEIRTKCGRKDLWEKWEPCDRVIIAYTLSPEHIVNRCEGATASLRERLESAALALEKGFRVRFCFDPMIYCPDWKQQYQDMLLLAERYVSFSRLYDVSVGSFRISQEYLKKMRRMAPASEVVQFPYVNVGGVYQYPTALQEEMEQYLTALLREKLPDEKIFRWK